MDRMNHILLHSAGVAGMVSEIVDKIPTGLIAGVITYALLYVGEILRVKLAKVRADNRELLERMRKRDEK